MFKKLIGLALMAAAMAPGAAFAGFGATASLGGLSDGTSWAPSLDWRQHGMLFSLQAIDLIGGLPDDQLNLGAGFAVNTVKRQVAPEIEGVVMPGIRLRYYALTGDTGSALDKAKVSSSGFNGVAELRMGMEMKKGMGFGVYVVPQIGASTIRDVGVTAAKDSEVSVTYGGAVEVSAWLLKM